MGIGGRAASPGDGRGGGPPPRGPPRRAAPPPRAAARAPATPTSTPPPTPPPAPPAPPPPAAAPHDALIAPPPAGLKQGLEEQLGRGKQAEGRGNQQAERQPGGLVAQQHVRRPGGRRPGRRRANRPQRAGRRLDVVLAEKQREPVATEPQR